jgi:hypothetical protein
MRKTLTLRLINLVFAKSLVSLLFLFVLLLPSYIFGQCIVTYTAPADLCLNAGVQAGLDNGTPTGGVYSGSGVTDDANGMTYSFDPAVAGAGTHTLTYTYTDGIACTSSATDDVEIFALPAVAYTALADICINEGVQTGLGGGTPTGGVYSGAGVTDGGNGMTYNFDAEAAGAGTHTLTYTYTDGNFCTNTASDDVEVFGESILTFIAPDDLCIDAGIQSGLNGGTPPGGVYSGTGVIDDGDGLTYQFDPAAAGVGVHMIAYTFVDMNGCTTTISDDVEVFELSVVTFTAPADLCINDGVQSGLDGGTPTGGAYSGTGVTDEGNGMTYSFDPTAGGAGVYTITYSYTDSNGCTNSASDDVEVFGLSIVTFTAPADLCVDAGVQAGENGGTPSGGVYSGAGVSDDANGMTYSFDPATAGAGTHTITYDYTDVNGCTNSASDDVEVFALPVVTFIASMDLCVDAGVQAGLDGGSPTGGVYSGTGVTDDANGMTYSFDPAAAGVGVHTITYDYTDSNGCSDSASDDVEVFDLPSVSFIALADICIDAGVQAGMGSGVPNGGVYSGSGVMDDGNGMTFSFDPVAAGVGVHTITYTYNDTNDCTGSFSDDVEVFDLPVVTFTAFADLCIDAGVQAGEGSGTPTGGVYSGAGVTDDANGMTYSFDPIAAGTGMQTITYDYTDINGCTNSALDNVEVFGLPVVTFTALADLCIDAGEQADGGSGTPTGGVYSGAGVTDDANGMTYSFDPAVAGVGVHSITYDYTDTNGCSSSASDDVEVFDTPLVDLVIEPFHCLDADIQNLPMTGGVPSGGVYSGAGITDNGNGISYFIDPTVNGVGTVTVTYSYTDDNGCSNSATSDIEIADCGATNSFEIDDPCSCLDNATPFDCNNNTGGDDGQFSEVVSITGAAAPLPNGMTWTIVGATGAFDAFNIPAIGMQSAGVAVLGDGSELLSYNTGVYEVPFVHVDDIGYTLMIEGPFAMGSAANVTFTISNKCQYPDPVFDPTVPLTIHTADAAITLGATDSNGGTADGVIFLIDGAPSTMLDPGALAVGPHTVVMTYDGAADGNGGISPDGGTTSASPGCIQEVTKEFEIVDCDLVVDCSNIFDQQLACRADLPPVDFNLPIIVDSCGATTLSALTIIPGDTGCPNDTLFITRTYFIQDAVGNMAQCVQTFTVISQLDPTFTSFPTDTTVLCGAATDPAVTGMAEGAGECDPVNPQAVISFNDAITPGACPAEMTITRTWTVTDRCGRSVDMDQIIMVVDTVGPNMLCQNIILQLDSFGMTTVLIPDELDNGSSDNCGGPVTLSISMDMFTCENIGDNDVMLYGEDQCGNIDSCTAVVTIEDNIAPMITCPMDSVIQLAPEQCEIIVTFDDPLFTDNCPGAVITQIAGLTSGSAFPIGESIISFEARDTTGNADTCTWSVIVNDYIPNGLLCNGEINFSIDEESCSGELLPSMLIDITSVGCADSCTITVKGADGIKRPPVFSTDDIGKTYEYEICCGGICCWGIVNVEFKFNPVIECVANDTLSCTQAFDESTIRPDISLSCAPATLLLIDEEIENFNCDTFFTAKMVRKYTAVDIYGNTSDTCEQTIFLRRTNLDSISPVQPFAIFNDEALSCSSGFATTNQGYPYPALSVTGAPRLRVEGGGFIDLYPFESALICNGFADYKDEIMPGSTSCVTKIIRTFTIGEWWCGSTNERTFKQLIEVVDFDGPEITCPANMTVSTGSFECTASVSFPLPTGEDACNNDLIYNIATPVGDIENYNGESFTLPAGVHTINYAVYDACEQGSFCSFTVTVVDNADPIAICDQFTEVSLSLETLTYVPAESIDDGSFDECGPVTLSVARMDDPGFEDFTGFGPEIDITCADAGQTIMVGLLVTDAGGNTNMCMVSVAVKDKVEAQMVCPIDTTVECNFAFDPDNLSAFFGEVQIYDNCPAANTIDETLVGDLNSCGSGVLIRQITLLNAQGVQTDYCEQTITFVSGTPLQFSDITPPNSPVEVNGCGIGALDAANITVPIIPDGVCQQVAMAIENDTFPFTEEGACLKIIRTYKVIDWCITSGPGSVTSPFEFVQIIKVSNSVKPVFTDVFEDSTYCSFAIDCGGIEVTGLTATSSDDCTVDSDLIRKYETRDAIGTIVKFGNGHDASGDYDLGDYTVRFIAEDKCGNQQVTESTFSIISCKQPVPYCLDGLSTSLTLMDPDEDGEFVAMVMLNTDFFDAGSYHPCSLDVTLSFSSDTTNKQIIFDCDGLGEQEVQLWVTDSNGNQDFCIASLDVQDNAGLCTGQMKPVDIQGRVYTSADAELNEATVQLISAEMQENMTDETGEYGFMDMPQGGNYSVAPNKDDDVLNGVSTLDLVMIQRHILGLAELDEAYKYIAADINHDDRVTASDLLSLRKTILGINTHFTNNTSWRFIDEQHVFEDETDPWSTPFAESYDIEGLSEDMWIDFVAVKVGDINGNVDANLQAGIISETRSAQSLIMTLPNTEVEEGKVYEIDVLTSDAINLRGLQLAFSLDELQLVDIKRGAMNIRSNDVANVDNELKMSYANAIGDYAQANDVLYTLVVRATSNGLLSEMIAISDKSLNAEAYIGKDLKVGSVEIEWRDDEVVVPVELLVANSISPNPWRSQADINFEIPREGAVSLTVRDVSGRVLYTKSDSFSAGKQSFTITNDDVKVTGILLYELKFGKQVVNKKMIRIE